MRHAQVPSRIYKYSCYQYNSLCIFICVCLVLSKTPIKLYSQKQLLLNNNYNSICIFIYVCLILSKTPIKVYFTNMSMSYHTIYNNSMCVSVCLHIANITCNIICIYICLARSLKNPYQTIFAKTVITE